MAHTCPDCGETCYCDIEDSDLGEDPPVDCPHVCVNDYEFEEEIFHDSMGYWPWEDEGE